MSIGHQLFAVGVLVGAALFAIFAGLVLIRALFPEPGPRRRG